MRGVLEIDQSSLGEVGLGLDEEVREREWLFNCSLIPSQSRCSVWPAWESGHMSLFPCLLSTGMKYDCLMMDSVPICMLTGIKYWNLMNALHKF